MSKIRYSILRYIPSHKNSINIVLGILLYNEKDSFKEFKHLEDLSILKDFENEIDISLVDKLLKGIREDVLICKKFDIDEYIKFFINDFYFEKSNLSDLNIESILDKDLEDILKEI